MNVLLGLTQSTQLRIDFYNLRVTRPRKKLTMGYVEYVRLVAC